MDVDGNILPCCLISNGECSYGIVNEDIDLNSCVLKHKQNFDKYVYCRKCHEKEFDSTVTYKLDR